MTKLSRQANDLVDHFFCLSSMCPQQMGTSYHVDTQFGGQRVHWFWHGFITGNSRAPCSSQIFWEHLSFLMISFRTCNVHCNWGFIYGDIRTKQSQPRNAWLFRSQVSSLANVVDASIWEPESNKSRKKASTTRSLVNQVATLLKTINRLRKRVITSLIIGRMTTWNKKASKISSKLQTTPKIGIIWGVCMMKTWWFDVSDFGKRPSRLLSPLP